MSSTETTVGGIVLIPLIIGIIQFCKRIFPSASGNVWLALSMLLGLAGRLALALSDKPPTDTAGWLFVVVAGFAFGLAASKAYDETLRT